MKIIKGRDKGKEVEISQWCNNWFSGKNGKIYSPTQIQLTLDEMSDVLTHNNNGYMFAVYELLCNGKFKRLRRLTQP